MKTYNETLEAIKQDFANLSNGSKDFHFSGKCALVQDRIELLQEAIKEVADATKRVQYDKTIAGIDNTEVLETLNNLTIYE